MLMEQEYIEKLAAYDKYCNLVCERHHIDRETLDDFMTFAKHMRCLADTIKKVNEQGASNCLSLQAGTMAHMARKMFIHLGYRLVTNGPLSDNEFHRLIDNLNLEMGDTEAKTDAGRGMYPIHYRASDMLHMFKIYIQAQAAIIRQLQQERGYAR